MSEIENTPVQIQVFTGTPNIGPGYVALVILNCPITPIQIPAIDGVAGNFDETIVPAIKISARQAMEIGMNMIYIAKLSESGQTTEGGK